MRDLSPSAPSVLQRHGDNFQNSNPWSARGWEISNCAPVPLQRLQWPLHADKGTAHLPACGGHERACARPADHGLSTHSILPSQHSTGNLLCYLQLPQATRADIIPWSLSGRLLQTCGGHSISVCTQFFWLMAKSLAERSSYIEGILTLLVFHILFISWTILIF